MMPAMRLTRQQVRDILQHEAFKLFEMFPGDDAAADMRMALAEKTLSEALQRIAYAGDDMTREEMVEAARHALQDAGY